MSRKFSRRPWVIVAGVLVVVIVVAVVGAAVAVRSDAVRQRIEAAAGQATGRTLTIGGGVSLAVAWPPTLVAGGIKLTNMAGGSRPDMLTMQQLRLSVSPLALLGGHLVITELDLRHPDILLETNAAGQGNWIFAKAAAQPVPGSPGAPTASPASPSDGLAVEAVRITDGHITLRDGATGQTIPFDISRAGLTAPTPTAPVHVSAGIEVSGLHVNIAVDTSSIVQLQKGGTPDLSALSIVADQADLGRIVPGLTLDGARIELPNNAAPATVTMSGKLGAAPFSAHASVASPALHGAAGTASIDASIEAAGADVAIKGSIADPAARTGLDAALTAKVPDLAALSPFAGRPLPPVKGIDFAAHLADGPGGFGHAVSLQNASLTTPQGDLVGSVTATVIGRPAVQAVLNANHLDVDALLAAIRATPQPAAGPAVAPPPPASPPPASAAPAPPALPFGLLDRGDADIKFSVASLQAAGVAVSNLSGHVVMKDGKLTAGPIQATVPGGALTLSASADGRQPAPPVALAITAPALDVKPLLALFGMPDAATGSLEVRTDLHAVGATQAALIASLTGRAGVGLTDTDVDNAVLLRSLGGVLKAANLPGLVPPNGRTRLKCLVVEAKAANGIAVLGPAVLDSTRLLMNVTGTVNLGAETLGLQLRPMLRTGGPGIVVPVRVDGPWRDPHAGLDPAGLAEAGVQTGVRSLLGTAAGLLGAKAIGRRIEMIGEHGEDACGPAIAAMRNPA